MRHAIGFCVQRIVYILEVAPSQYLKYKLAFGYYRYKKMLFDPTNLQNLQDNCCILFIRGVRTNEEDV